MMTTQMRIPVLSGTLSVVDMPRTPKVRSQVPPLVLVPLAFPAEFPCPIGSKISPMASVLALIQLMPPQDPPRTKSQKSHLRVLGLLTGASHSSHAIPSMLRATSRPPRGSSPTGTHRRTRRLRTEAVVRIAAKNVPSEKAPKYLKPIAGVLKVQHAGLPTSFVLWYFVQALILS